jgi:hypothetical protein
MKTENAIVLGLSAMAVYFIVKSSPGLLDKAKATVGLTSLTKSPAYWTSQDIGNDAIAQYQSYAYGRQGL